MCTNLDKSEVNLVSPDSLIQKSVVNMERNYISASYVWDRRIHHGVRYQKGPVPFPESVAVGVDFNAAFQRKEKLDLCLLTNGVIMEFCEFSKTVIRSEMYFLFEILDFNFDLGIDPGDGRQLYSYTTRVHSKIKALKEHMRLKTNRYQEVFTLPDPLEPAELAKCYCPKRSKKDVSVLSKHSSCQSSITEQDEHAFVMNKPRRIKVKLMTDAFPNCIRNGVTLVISPKDTPRQKLDPSLLTLGVAFELLDFSKVLCGTQNQILQDLVQQNFGHMLEMIYFRLNISKLQERKNGCLTHEAKAAFRKEPFKVSDGTKRREYRKRKTCDLNPEDFLITTKRRSTMRPSYTEPPEFWEESNLSYMCPVDFEANTEGVSDVEKKPEETMEIKQEDESFLSSESLQTSDQFNPRLTSAAYQDLTGLFSEHAHDNTNAKTPKLKLWMRRAARSKQILASSRVNDMFARCREICLDFNVGSGRKQTLDLQLLTNLTLYEVNKFASAMTKSLGSLFFSLIENNFNLSFQDELLQRNFVFYMFTKEKLLQNHPCRENPEFLNMCIKYPDVYNVAVLKSEGDVEPEPDTATLDESQEMDPAYPYCSKIGLDVWAVEPRPLSKKLDVTSLTKGAILEILSFIRELCGTAREIVNDILEHNFNINLQDLSSEPSKAIHKWYLTQKPLMTKRPLGSSRDTKWSTTLVISSAVPELIPVKTEHKTKDLDPGPLVQVAEVPDFNAAEPPAPKVEYTYDVCQQIGLDLDVHSKPAGKEKLDLHVLTRAALFEIHNYVETNCNRYVPALYEILEYNFDLSSQNHRKVQFAWSIASQVLAMVGKRKRSDGYMKREFELPFELPEGSEVTCKEEPDEHRGELQQDGDENEVEFVLELKPVDIEVEVE